MDQDAGNGAPMRIGNDELLWQGKIKAPYELQLMSF